jgi:hypothetical protein
MTDKELIENFINRNYVLKADSYDIVFVDKETKKLYSLDWFYSFMKKMFGNIPTLNEIINEFYNENSKIIVAELYSYFDTLNLSLKSIECSALVSAFCQVSGAYSREFAHKRFIDYYMEKYFDGPDFENLKNKINLEYHSSNNMVSLLDITNEIPAVSGKIFTAFDEWYFENVMDKKIKTFLDRSQVYLGENNWEVRNLDYGKMNINNVLKYFPDENSYQKNMIEKSVNEWCLNQQIEFTEKSINVIWG